MVFKGRGRLGEHAKHYVLLAKAERHDIFDGKGAPKTQYITLSAPTAGRTLAARKAMNRKRQAEIKAGTRDVKRRDAPRKTRIMRLGVSARPRAVVSNGVWTIPDKERRRRGVTMTDKQPSKLDRLRAMREAGIERNKKLIYKTVRRRKLVKLKRGK